MTKVVDFGQAEKNARKKDFEIENKKFEQDHNEVSKAELEQAMEIMAKATGKELYIGTKRSPQSKVRFAQFMQNNLGFLRQNKYLTAREKSFFIDITPLIAFDSNCIVEDIKAKNPAPMNISQIADFLGADRSNTSKIINSLKRKGLLFKGESGLEGNNAKAYAIFINPHIIYAGDKDNINKALQIMFHKAMKMKILKDLPDRLF
ncbi:helix-turn-helix domain-containing protein [Bacillus cereus group sp. N21]|uniref:MarR family transcriptional regulator n=1 Tax=Bacillus cereus group sp. N21 TaxID=2794591 RepID=UPI0018F40F13|nr:helix-turn-helix domain-containing protein [Bacillus cereus group sp. N21]MBJ8031661.1 MarR family transcriptional regulator [Bacillus cereus group sp. N21]